MNLTKAAIALFATAVVPSVSATVRYKVTECNYADKLMFNWDFQSKGRCMVARMLDENNNVFPGVDATTKHWTVFDHEEQIKVKPRFETFECNEEEKKRYKWNGEGRCYATRRVDAAGKVIPTATKTPPPPPSPDSDESTETTTPTKPCSFLQTIYNIIAWIQTCIAIAKWTLQLVGLVTVVRAVLAEKPKVEPTKKEPTVTPRYPNLFEPYDPSKDEKNKKVVEEEPRKDPFLIYDSPYMTYYSFDSSSNNSSSSLLRPIIRTEAARCF